MKRLCHRLLRTSADVCNGSRTPVDLWPRCIFTPRKLPVIEHLANPIASDPITDDAQHRSLPSQQC